MELRKSNLELLRIVAMLMIVLSHCTYFGVVKVFQSDAYHIWSVGGVFYKLVSCLSVLGTIGVGCFFMITGYFTFNKKKTSIKRVVTVTLFYSWLVIIISLALTICNIPVYSSKGEFILGMSKNIFTPITGSVWWYVTAYVVLLLIAPTYNCFLEKLNKNGMFIWILLLLIFGYTLGNLGSSLHDLEKAVFFYTLGAYFREYLSDNSDKRIYIGFASVGILINGICQYGIFSQALYDTTSAELVRKLFSMTGYLVAEPLATVGIFGLFNMISLHSEIINKMASHMFGVYLFHESPMMRSFLWIHVLKPYAYYNKMSYIPYVIFCVLFVFLLGVFIDKTRILFFDKKMNRIVEGLLKKFYDKCYKQ